MASELSGKYLILMLFRCNLMPEAEDALRHGTKKISELQVRRDFGGHWSVYARADRIDFVDLNGESVTLEVRRARPKYAHPASVTFDDLKRLLPKLGTLPPEPEVVVKVADPAPVEIPPQIDEAYQRFLDVARETFIRRAGVPYVVRKRGVSEFLSFQFGDEHWVQDPHHATHFARKSDAELAYSSSGTEILPATQAMVF
jgi:hypothetical protein